MKTFYVSARADGFLRRFKVRASDTQDAIKQARARHPFGLMSIGSVPMPGAEYRAAWSFRV